MTHKLKLYLLAVLTLIVSCNKEKTKQLSTIKNEAALKDSIHQTDTLAKTIAFKVKYPPKDDDIKNIDFSKEKPKCEFTLKGKIPLKYCFYLENDSVATIQQFKNNKFQFQENLNYQPFLWHFDNNLLFSQFKIFDFDSDGDEDVLCWVFSNINGNEWTIVFLNDQSQQKLVRLIDTVEETDIWARPKFDKKNKIISTERYGSAFGTSEESSYRLENDLSVIPLKKHFQDRSEENAYDYFYVGQNGKWKLKSKKRVEN